MPEVIAYINQVEGDICLRINRLSHRLWIRQFFAVVSRLGDGGFWLLMGVVVLLVQGSRALPSLLHVAVTAAVGVVIYKLLKNRLIRERPYINHGDIICGTAPLDRYSFPSGHTLHAVSLAATLSHIEPALISLVVPFAVLVAASRVILGLHYPSDVIAGAALGATLGSTSIFLF